MSTNSLARFGQRGISLIELVMFIVIVGVALAGIASAINYNVQHSADPIVKKQALAIAESLLEEAELMPFTWCDEEDPNIATAASAAGCTAGMAEAMGPETIAGVTETRGSSATPFDNVNDYNGYCMATPGCAVTSVVDITGTGNLNLAGYTALVAVTADTMAAGGLSIAAASGAALRITVTVTGPMNTTVVLEGYRTRYAPNATM